MSAKCLLILYKEIRFFYDWCEPVTTDIDHVIPVYIKSNSSDSNILKRPPSQVSVTRQDE